MAVAAHGADGPCEEVDYAGNRYTVCSFDLAKDSIEVFWRDDKSRPYGAFRPLAEGLRKKGLELTFAMNAGMYNDKLAPIGLYVEKGKTFKSANTRKGPGNFHLMPNGIFFLADGKAGVMETKAFLAKGITPQLATQSGPMLVIDGALHPKFLKGSDSRKVRNGVGVRAGGKDVVFVISEDAVNFHSFASLFRDRLKAPNALFLDGGISSLHAPSLNRSDWGRAMGPIVGVVRMAQ